MECAVRYKMSIIISWSLEVAESIFSQPVTLLISTGFERAPTHRSRVIWRIYADVAINNQ